MFGHVRHSHARTWPSFSSCANRRVSRSTTTYVRHHNTWMPRFKSNIVALMHCCSVAGCCIQIQYSGFEAYFTRALALQPANRSCSRVDIPGRVHRETRSHKRLANRSAKKLVQSIC